MARNGSGTQSTPNTFVSGNTVTASGHNQNWTDIASEMTNSVAADGQTSMTGPLKAANGTAAAPGWTFASDTDTGMYRVSGNTLGFASGGSNVMTMDGGGLGVVGAVNATALQQGGFSALMVGEIKLWAGSAIPSGFLACQGQSLLRASYPALFTAIGTTYGAVDGTHFNVPDLGGRAPFGKEASATRLTTAGSGVDGGTLGASGGAQNKTLLTTNLPAQTPAGTLSLSTTIVWQPVQSGTGIGAYVPSASGSGALNTGVTPTGTFSGTAFAGQNSTAFGIVPPALVLNYIIFAGV